MIIIISRVNFIEKFLTFNDINFTSKTLEWNRSEHRTKSVGWFGFGRHGYDRVWVQE